MPKKPPPQPYKGPLHVFNDDHPAANDYVEALAGMNEAYLSIMGGLVHNISGAAKRAAGLLENAAKKLRSAAKQHDKVIDEMRRREKVKKDRAAGVRKRAARVVNGPGTRAPASSLGYILSQHSKG